MTSIYYSAAWIELGCLVTCWHEHETIVRADSCIPCAGGYVVGVENGVMRSLTTEEEAEFQRVHYVPRTDRPPLDAVRAAEEQYRNGGTRYAVMVKINGYEWTTWMTYDTYSKASAHVGTAHRIVVFGSPQWVELENRIQSVLNEEPKEFKRSTCAPSRLTRREGETLLEYVNRILEAYGVSQRTLTRENNKYSYVTRRPLRVRVSDFVDFVLNWLSEWETKELERMHALQVSAWLEALAKRVRRALTHDAPSGR
jgi:hypothetical protein